MRSFLDAKSMAKTLREALADQNIQIPHSLSLELVARQFGLNDWNTLAARIAMALPDTKPLTLPRGWFVTRQTDERYYRAGLAPDAPGVAVVECRLPRGGAIDLSASHFASLMQSIVAAPYRGGRVKLSAHLSTEDADSGSIWLRVDAAPGRVLTFDNMMEREKDGALKGTCGWVERSVVLNVPEEATTLHYGVILMGHGLVRARGLKLVSVGKDVRTTSGDRTLEEPSNLDFADVA